MINIGLTEEKKRVKGERLNYLPDNYVVIDIETTGLSPADDKIIEIGALKVCNGAIIDSFSTLVNPGQRLNDFIIDLTGITNEMLVGMDDIAVVINTFHEFIEDFPLVGHNVHFDINFLYDATLLHLNKQLSNDFIDTLYISRKKLSHLESKQLAHVAKELDISIENEHRAISDCHTTMKIAIKLFNLNASDSDKDELNERVIFDNLEESWKGSPQVPKPQSLQGKKIAFKGSFDSYSFSFYKKICAVYNMHFSEFFYNNIDILVFSNYKYKLFQKEDYSSFHIDKARKLVNDKDFILFSESQFCEMLGIPSKALSNNKKQNSLNIKEITSAKLNFDESHALYEAHIVFTGTLEKMSRKEAMQLAVNYGAILDNSVTRKTNFLVLGNNDYCKTIINGKSSKQKKAESLILSGQDLKIIPESVFYDLVLSFNE